MAELQKQESNLGSVSNLEDTRESREDPKSKETTRLERYAWVVWVVLIGASSVLTTVAFEFLFPLYLTYLATRAGSAYPKTPSGAAPDFQELSRTNATWFQPGSCIESAHCVVPWLNSHINVSSWVLNMTALAILGNVPLYLSLNAFADHGKGRKAMFLFFAFSGAFLTAIAAGVGPDHYVAGGLILFFVNVCFVVANVFYNAYLPILASCHPNMVVAKASENANPSLGGQEHLTRRLDHYTQSLSSYSTAVGYFTAIFTALTAALVYANVKSPDSLKGILFFTAIWWILLTFPSLFFLKQRPGEPLPKGTWYLFYSWKALFKVIFAVPKIPLIFVYLFAFFLFSDGAHTFSAVMILLGKNEIKMNDIEVSILMVSSPIASLIGTLVFYQIQKRIGMSSKAMLLLTLSLFIGMCAYGALGLTNLGLMQFNNSIPLTKECIPDRSKGYTVYTGEGCIDMQHEFFILFMAQEFVIGALKANARTLYTTMIPPNQESLFFSLFELSGRTSVWMGPLVTSYMNEKLGTLKYSFVYLLIVFIIPFPIIALINFGKARAQAVAYAKTLTGGGRKVSLTAGMKERDADPASVEDTKE